MITDVLAAAPEAISEYRRAGFPDPRRHGFRAVRARGLDPPALLDVLVSRADPLEALDTATRAPGQEPDLYAAPVVTALSERTVRHLPAIADQELPRLARDWANEPELSGFDPAALEGRLSQVRQLCRDTVPAGHLIFVWNCL